MLKDDPDDLQAKLVLCELRAPDADPELLKTVIEREERDGAWAEFYSQMPHIHGRAPFLKMMALYVDERIWEASEVLEDMEVGVRGAWMRRLIEKHEKASGIKDPYWRLVTRVRILKEIWSKIEEYEMPRPRRQKTAIEANMHLFPAPERPEEGGFWKASGETTRVFSTRWRHATTKGRHHWSWGAKRAFTLETAGVRMDVCGTMADGDVVFSTNPYKLQSEVRRA